MSTALLTANSTLLRCEKENVIKQQKSQFRQLKQKKLQITNCRTTCHYLSDFGKVLIFTNWIYPPHLFRLFSIY